MREKPTGARAIIEDMSERPSLQIILAGIVIILLTIALGISPQPDNVQKALVYAAQYESEGLYTQAIIQYRIASEWQPYRADLREKMAIAAFKMNDLDTALTGLKQIEKENALSSKGWLTLGDIYFQKNNQDLALAAYNKIAVGSPEAEASRKNRLQIYAQSKKWMEAVDYLTTEYENTGDDQTLILLAGFEAFQDPQKSLELIQQGQGVYVPELEQILGGLSIVGQDNETKSAQFLKMGQYYESINIGSIAEAAYRFSSEIAPDSAVALASLGRYLSSANAGGEAEIARALELAPDNPIVNQIVGKYWIAQNKPDIALIYLKKTSRLDLQSPENWILLGDTYNKLGDYQTGLQQWVHAAELSQSPEPIWRQIAEFCVLNQVFIDKFGLDAVQKLLLENPVSAENLDLAGRVYLSLDDSYTGEKYLRSAIQQFPEYYPAQLHLGIWLVSSGKYEEGREWIDSAANQTADEVTRKQAVDFLAEN